MSSVDRTSSPLSQKKVTGRRPIRDNPNKGMPDSRGTSRRTSGDTKHVESNLSDNGNISSLSDDECEVDNGNISSSSDDEYEVKRSPSPPLTYKRNIISEKERSPSFTSPSKRKIILGKERSPSRPSPYRHNVTSWMDDITLESAEIPISSGNAGNNYFKGKYIIMFIIVVGFAVFCPIYLTKTLAKGPVAEQNTCEELDVTNNIFSKQFDFMALKISVENTIYRKPPKPSIFIFLQDDPAYTNKAMKEIVTVTRTCFGSEAKFIKLDTGYFTSKNLTEDHGIAVEHVKEEFKNGGVLWVPDLHKIPAKVARAFHAICDTYTPLVEKLVVYFTLTPTKKEGNPTQLAEDTLHLLWEELPSSELDPLITRITDQVLWINRAEF